MRLCRRRTDTSVGHAILLVNQLTSSHLIAFRSVVVVGAAASLVGSRQLPSDTNKMLLVQIAS